MDHVWLSFIDQMYVWSRIDMVSVAKRDLLISKVCLNSHTFVGP